MSRAKVQLREDEPIDAYWQRYKLDRSHMDGILAASQPMPPEHEKFRDAIALDMADAQRNYGGGDLAVSIYVRAYLSARRMIELERHDLFEDRFWPHLQPPDQQSGGSA